MDVVSLGGGRRPFHPHQANPTNIFRAITSLCEGAAKCQEDNRLTSQNREQCVDVHELSLTHSRRIPSTQ